MYSVASWILWGAAALLLGVSWIAQNPHVGMVGLASSAAAATVTTRCYFIAQTEMMRAAFDLGREAGSGSVQRIR